MAKFNAVVRAGKGDASMANEKVKAPAVDAEAVPATTAPKSDKVDPVAVVATIGAVGVVAALVDIALIPGIVIGVAAAFAPRVVPKLGDRLEPLFERTVKGAVKLSRKARSVVAEAHERVGDITAEVDAEEAAKTGEAAAAA